MLEALDIDEKALGKDHPNYAGNLHSLVPIYTGTMERYEKAEALYLEVGAILKKAFGEAHPEYARSLANLAAVYESTGRYEKAERLYLDVKAIWSNALGELHPYYARSLYSLAALYWMLGDDEKAALFFEQASAIERILLVRASHHLSEREMAAYANTFAQRQGLSLSFTHSKRRLAKSNYDDALFYKGFLLNATQHVGRLAVAEPASRDIYHRLKGYHRRLAAEYAKPVAERQNTGELEEKANALEKELARTVAGFGEALRQVTWQEVQAALQEGEAAVEFIHYQYHGPAPADSILYAAFVLRPGDEQPHFVPLFEEKMLGSLFPSKDEAQAGTFLTQAYASRGITPTPRNDYPNLYELVWQPLDSLLAGAKTVYASPSGLLHRINLGAVMTDSSLPFVSFHRLVRLNSTRQLAFRNPQPAMANHQHPIFATLYGGIYYNMDSLAIAGANRDYGAGSNSLEAFSFVMLGEDRAEAEGEPEAWGPLPGAAEEVAKIAELLRVGGGQANVLAGFAATEESFKQLGRDKPSPRILHLATHGFFYPDPAEYRNSSPSEEVGGAGELSSYPTIP
ncbi:MAG: tetratricopeptide repeat protein [Lewinellaceae bacterium]|nr:tetratricopeptide repeat protein [Lewinellaceae bacterium]